MGPFLLIISLIPPLLQGSGLRSFLIKKGQWHKKGLGEEVIALDFSLMTQRPNLLE